MAERVLLGIMDCKCDICEKRGKRWGLVKIKVRKDQNPEEYEEREEGGLIYGPLAIIHEQGTGIPWWSITHIPTGYSVVLMLESLIGARRTIRRILGLGLNWDFNDPQAMPVETRKIMRDFLYAQV